MKRTVAIAFSVATALVMGAIPAAALSCAIVDPLDMKAAIAQADAAAIGTVTSISSVTDDGWGTAELTVKVNEVFKGSVSGRLTLDREITVWGPFYEEGQELALVVNDGVVRDGQDSLCGPFFSPADMREAGGEPTIVVGEPHPGPEPTGWNMFGLLSGLFDLLRFLFSVG